MLSIRLEQKYAKRLLSLRIATYLIEYLGEFEFIFETVSGYVSGDQMGSFEAKKTKSKISCLGTFKTKIWLTLVYLLQRTDIWMRIPAGNVGKL